LIGGASLTELMTYEGNSSNAVRCVRRQRMSNMRYSRIILDTTGTCPAVIAKVPQPGSGTR
jgi:hypothetical protein